MTTGRIIDTVNAAYQDELAVALGGVVGAAAVAAAAIAAALTLQGMPVARHDPSVFNQAAPCCVSRATGVAPNVFTPGERP
jgi:hypothetical protein